MKWTRTGIVLCIILAVLAVARFIYGHELNLLDFLFSMTIIIAAAVEEGFEKVYKRLDEIAEAVAHDN